MSRLQAIDARLEAATPRPWAAGIPGDAVVSVSTDTRPLERLTPQDDLVTYYGGEPVAESMRPGDRELVINAPDDLAWATGLLRQLLAGLAQVDVELEHGRNGNVRRRVRELLEAAADA